MNDMWYNLDYFLRRWGNGTCSFSGRKSFMHLKMNNINSDIFGVIMSYVYFDFQINIVLWYRCLNKWYAWCIVDKLQQTHNMLPKYNIDRTLRIKCETMDLLSEKVNLFNWWIDWIIPMFSNKYFTFTNDKYLINSTVDQMLIDKWWSNIKDQFNKKDPQALVNGSFWDLFYTNQGMCGKVLNECVVTYVYNKCHATTINFKSISPEELYNMLWPVVSEWNKKIDIIIIIEKRYSHYVNHIKPVLDDVNLYKLVCNNITI